MTAQRKQSNIHNLIYKRSMIKKTLACLTLSVMICPSYSYAQEDNSREVISLQNQVAQLKAQINQLQVQNGDVGDDDSDSHRKKKHKDRDKDETLDSNNTLLPDLVSRINILEDQQRTMRGELDDLTNQIKTQTNLLNKKIDDMNFTAEHGDGANSGTSFGKAAVGVGAATAIPSSVASSKFSASTNGGTSLKDGQQALVNGNFQEAEFIAQKIISSPEGAKSVNARFLLAQAQAGQGNFKASSVSYYTVYKNFPKSPKAPVALLGVGYSMLKNGKTQEACQALTLLHSKFPNASDQVKSSALKLSRKAKCS